MTGGADGGRPDLQQVLDAVTARLPRVEVLAKRGRSRVVESTPEGLVVSFHREEGWAVRAGDDRGSWFAAATGAPSADGPGGAWPAPDGAGLELPRPTSPPLAAEGAHDAWRDPPDLETPLAGEREAAGLLETLGRELAAELPAARLLRARLTDGASEWWIASRLDGAPGVEGAARGRAASLRVEAMLPMPSRGGARTATAELEIAERAAARFDPRALARRLADRLSVGARGTAPERDRAIALLAPRIGARIVAALVPLFFGGRQGGGLAAATRRRLEDRDGRFAADAVTIRDDPRLPDGVLATPIDGEGLATAVATLVDAGSLRPPLVPPHTSRGARSGPTGDPGRPWPCARRPSWRDLPRPGPSHLYLAPSLGTGVGELLAGVPRGYYLIDLEGPVRLDLEADRMRIPVAGFRIESGRAAGPVAGAVLETGLGSFLRRIDLAARDLTFFPIAGGMIGAPTLRVRGVEIRGR